MARQPEACSMKRFKYWARYATKLGPDVEIIQRHHRYAVVWPSINPKTDRKSVV